MADPPPSIRSGNASQNLQRTDPTAGRHPSPQRARFAGRTNVSPRPKFERSQSFRTVHGQNAPSSARPRKRLCVSQEIEFRQSPRW
ncbi:hypothetical protein F0562_009586 [Nyssa sinensis]|uniref:Uncharacterized protein n=1 Tax=Nyssa sinensis TaxID=561372 RepID=A0A5J4ZWF6_9ASTE|nr:hypothetical protein F0562_009586 [Nyssa sinensis]